MQFIPGKSYNFTGSKNLVDLVNPAIAEDVNNNGIVNDNPLFLGKFIEYRGFPQGPDWLPDAKARFENGYVSKGYYYAVISICDIE